MQTRIRAKFQFLWGKEEYGDGGGDSEDNDAADDGSDEGNKKKS